MSVILFVVAAAAAVPQVPSDVQIISEGGAYVMRTLDGGKPLYTFDGDEPGKSNCVDRCLAAWPALAAKPGSKQTGGWTVITRPDGSAQWALGGKPVYTFVRDSEGKATSDGMGGKWHLLPTAPAN